MPLLHERVLILREAAEVLHESFGDEDYDDNSVPAVGMQVESAATNEAHHASSVENVADELAAVTVTDVATSTDAAMADRRDDVLDGKPSEATAETAIPGAQDMEQAEGTEHQPVPDTQAHAVIQHEHAPPDLTQPSHADALPQPDLSVVRLIEKAEHSAGKLVNLLAKHFPCFRDETRFDGRRVRFLKRAQIFVADLWAAFNGTGYGAFDDIRCLTMFADYRVPQMLHTLGVLSYSPPLLYRLRDKKEIPSGHSWEVQLRGCSIWAVELIRREIVREHPEAEVEVNAVLIDFFLYDLAKERERGVGGGLEVPHHRTRGIWY